MPSNTLKILFIGDIVASTGRRAVRELLPKLKKQHAVDLVIANVENLAHGVGITEATIENMWEAGVDVGTSGNHIWKNPGYEELLKSTKYHLVRPANYPPKCPGVGAKIINIGKLEVLVINIMGRVFFREDLDCPFRAVDEILKKNKQKIVFVDFHAEATSEKRAMGFYLDGRVSAVVGTHTHVATNDAQVLPKGTAYISDVGMVGALDSVLGVEKEPIIKRFITQMPIRHEHPAGLAEFGAVVIEIDKKTGHAKSIKTIREFVE